MPQGLIDIIVKYGYLAIFCLVFFQEMGFSLFSNEILLIYFGYLAHEGILYFPLVFGLAITADITGTALLYILFYYFNPFLLRHKPKWLKLPYRRIVLLKKEWKQELIGEFS
jgi:membrane protein DedA with SNARE-associated domain